MTTLFSHTAHFCYSDLFTQTLPISPYNDFIVTYCSFFLFLFFPHSDSMGNHTLSIFHYKDMIDRSHTVNLSHNDMIEKIHTACFRHNDMIDKSMPIFRQNDNIMKSHITAHFSSQ